MAQLRRVPGILLYIAYEPASVRPFPRVRLKYSHSFSFVVHLEICQASSECCKNDRVLLTRTYSPRWASCSVLILITRTRPTCLRHKTTTRAEQLRLALSARDAPHRPLVWGVLFSADHGESKGGATVDEEATVCSGSSERDRDGGMDEQASICHCGGCRDIRSPQSKTVRLVCHRLLLDQPHRTRTCQVAG